MRLDPVAKEKREKEMVEAAVITLSLSDFELKVQQQVEDWLLESDGPLELKELVREALIQPGQILARQETGRKTKVFGLAWHSLSREGNSPTVQMARVAAALELIISSFDVFDDVQDGKLFFEDDQQTTALWINAALYILFAGQRFFDEAADELPTLNKLRTLFHKHVLQAVHGQWFDLASEKQTCTADTSQAALQIAQLKAGSLIGAIFEAAAQMAYVDSEVVQLAREFGEIVGIVRQILNDVASLNPHNFELDLSPARSIIIKDGDLSRRKKTLPIAFALNFATATPKPDNRELLEHYGQVAAKPLTAAEYRKLCNIVWSCGSAGFIEVILQAYRLHAAEIVQKLQARGFGATESWLDLLS